MQKSYVMWKEGRVTLGLPFAKDVLIIGLLHSNCKVCADLTGRRLKKIKNHQVEGTPFYRWSKLDTFFLSFCREKQLSYNCLSSDINPSPSRTSVGDIWRGYFKIYMSLPFWRLAQEGALEKKSHDGNKKILSNLCRPWEPWKIIGQQPITKQIKISSLITAVTALPAVFLLCRFQWLNMSM